MCGGVGVVSESGRCGRRGRPARGMVNYASADDYGGSRRALCVAPGTYHAQSQQGTLTQLVLVAITYQDLLDRSLVRKSCTRRL